MGDAFRRYRKIDALPAGDLQRRYANHLSLHVNYRTAARAGRDRRSDLNDSSKRGNVADGRHDAICNASFQAKRISDYDDAFAFLRRGPIERKRTHLIGRRFNAQQRDVAFSINRDHAFNRIDVAIVRMDFGAVGVFDYVAVSDDAIRTMKKPLPRESFSPRASKVSIATADGLMRRTSSGSRS